MFGNQTNARYLIRDPEMPGSSRRILRGILCGAGSRAGLQKALGLSPGTISEQIAGMVRAGLLVEAAAPSNASRGRPRIGLQAHPRTFAAAGLDFGSGHLRGGLFSADGQVLGWLEISRVWNHAEEALGAAKLMLPRLLAALPLGTPLLGLGIADPGMVETGSGRSLGAVHIPGWQDFRLADVMTVCGPRVVVRPSAQMKGLAEMLHGGLRGVRNGVFLDLGMGVGAALMLEGHVLGGHRGLAGEFGHVCVNPSGLDCTCGGRGCLETECSGRAIASAAAKARTDGTLLGNSLLLRGRSPDAQAVARAALAGDPLARKIYGRAGRMLGIALGGLIKLLDPEYVIVGGGLSAAGDLLMDPAKEVLRSQALCASAGLPAIRFSPLSLTQVGALGAASSVMLNYLEAA